MTLFFLVLAGLFLALNAFFVLAEFAIVKVRATRLEELARAGDRRAALAQRIARELDAYLSVCQLGITIASLGLGWLGEPAFARALRSLLPETLPWAPAVSHTLAVAIAFSLVTFLHILLGELVPKALAIRQPETSALRTAVPLRLFHALFLVPMTVLNAAQDAVLKILGVPAARTHPDGTYTEQELRLILSLSEEGGSIPLGRLLLFENLFDFAKLRVSDAMIRMDRVDRINLADPWEKTSATLRQTGRSRLPVWEGNAPHPVGLLHVKDLWLKGLAAAAGPDDLRPLIRPLGTLSEKTPLETALRACQRARSHMMLVVNEKGKPVGILTLEDILEELVGNIEDEFERHAVYYLADAIPPDGVSLDLAAHDARAAVRELAETACRAIGALGAVKPAQVAEAVWTRGQGAIPDAGNGVAIPHARLPGLKAPVVIVGRSRNGIPVDGRRGTGDGGAPEGRLHLFFLILSPEEAPRAHVQILARVAGIAESAYVRERLLEAESPREILDIIRSSDPVRHSE